MSTSASGERARVKWSRGRKLVLALSVLVLLFLAAEAALRVRFFLHYGTFRYMQSIERDPRSGLPILEAHRKTNSIETDSRGFRNPELEVPKPAGRVRIAYLGGSTTFCAEASSNDATWPARATAALAAKHPKSSLDFVNAGVPGYRLDALHKTLEFRVKDLAPDVIVVYEATNDLIFDTTELAKAQGLYSGQADPDDALARISFVAYLVEKNLRAAARETAARDATHRLSFDPSPSAARFRENLLSLVRDAQEVAPVVALVTFSQRLRPGQSPDAQVAACKTHSYYMPFMSAESLLAGFAAYNQAIRDVAKETGAILIEGEDEIPADSTHFADSVHFTDAGCRAQADRVARGLESAAAFVSLVNR